MSLKANKSLYMVFHRFKIKRSTIGDVVLGNFKLIKVDSAKYIGVIIDHELNWLEDMAFAKTNSKGSGIM